MSTALATFGLCRRVAAAVVVICLCSGGCVPSAAAQQIGPTEEAGQGPPPPPAEPPGFFGGIARWFKGAGKQVQIFGYEAGIAAKTTVDGAKGAAEAVARIPKARLVKGHEVCLNAPNGAPDCVAAAINICKGQGFETGKSLDMTTAEICPAKVYRSGRNTGPECRLETFVSGALCQ